jgi:hypothetical protein
MTPDDICVSRLIDHIEKTNITGCDIREDRCPKCRGTQIVDRAQVLCKILDHAR